MVKIIVKIISLMSALMAAMGLLAATPTLTKVTAQQRYPWNGKVDIVVTMNGASNDVAQATCAFFATNSLTQAALAIKSVIEAGTDPVVAGTDPTTWTRRYVWDATADLGEVKIADVAITAEAKTGVQLWANGPYWAECNVGASKPEEYGAYFWWGDTVGYKRVGSSWNSVDGSTTGFSFASENCPTYGKDASSLQSLGYIDATGNLVAEHDAATAHLRAPWRMPTLPEINALLENCTTTWFTTNGVSGYLVTGKGDYISKSIFLPAAGCGDGSSLLNTGLCGNYWSSTPYSDNSSYAWGLFFDSSNFYRNFNYIRYSGRAVRPLRESALPLRECALSRVTGPSVVAHVALDTRTGARSNIGTTEQIRFSPAWETTADGAVATVCLNGVAVTNATEAGTFEWTLEQEGAYTLTHTVAVDGVQIGETLSATFNVRLSTQTTDIPVPFDWLKRYYPSVRDCESKAKETAANGHNTVEEAYVAGLDPTSATSELEATVVCSNGMVYVGWTPNLNTGTVTRIYTLSGRTDLAKDDWETPIRRWHRFFKVAVAMPTGATGETTSVAGEGFVPRDDPGALGGVQLWEDGPYWAECNVGASKPEDYGYYFWCGDTVGYTPEGGTWIPDTGGGYWTDVTWVPHTGESMVDATNNLVAAHDAATVYLGTPWRMPTESEMRALIENCTTTRTMRNGVYGRLVTGKGAYAAKSIFLPAAGYGWASSRFDHPDSYGSYWTSTSTWYLEFTSRSYSEECFQLDYFYTDNPSYRMSVRPLREFVP